MNDTINESWAITLSPPAYDRAAEHAEPGASAIPLERAPGSLHSARAARPEAPPAATFGDRPGPDRPPGREAVPAQPVSFPNVRAVDLIAAQERATLCERFLKLTGPPNYYSVSGAARALGCSAGMFSGVDSALARYQRGGLAALLPEARVPNGATVADFTKQIESLGWFVPVANYFYTRTNAGEGRGSVPEALRRTLRLPDLPSGWNRAMRRKFAAWLAEQGYAAVPACPPALRAALLARARAGQAMVSERVAHQVSVDTNVVAFSRNAREWDLNTLSAPGSQRRYRAASGQRIIMEPGDWFGGDDATQGIGTCVPCNEVVTPCSQKFKVLLGRFQLLLFIDCRTDKVLAWDFVVRPRGSYRGEDVLHGMGMVTRLHGIPHQGWQFEGGTFNCRAIRHAIQLMGCQHWRTYSPHQKAIESLFNRIWTRLAVQFPHADLGRRRGENEANCKLYESCKAGHQDPRRYFPPLAMLIQIIEEEVAEHNSRLIQSAQYGRWVPDEFFSQETAANPLRPFSREMRWIFSPFCAERTVRGMQVSCTVPMFEDFSVPFNFGAEWLHEFTRRKVRMHFDPNAPSNECVAKLVLLDEFGRHRAEEILGDARLIGETAGHVRFILNLAQDDQQAGYVMRQRAARYVRRVGRSVGLGGRAEYASDEQRDGIAASVTAEREPAGQRAESPLARVRPQAPEENDVNLEHRLARLRGRCGSPTAARRMTL